MRKLLLFCLLLSLALPPEGPAGRAYGCTTDVSCIEACEAAREKECLP